MADQQQGTNNKAKVMCLPFDGAPGGKAVCFNSVDVLTVKHVIMPHCTFIKVILDVLGHPLMVRV